MLGIGSGSAVSRQLRKVSQKLQTDRALERLLRQIEQRLQGRRDRSIKKAVKC